LQYYFSWKIGNWFTPAEHSWDEVSGLLDAVVNGENYRGAFTVLAEIGLDSLVILIGGGIILATPFTIAFYVLTYMFFRSINKKRLEKHVLD
jgi:uncharacterized protein (DUF2062 family)